MRIILFLSLVVLAVSGCNSSAVCMYSVPTQRKMSTRSQNMCVNTKSLSYAPYNRTAVNKRVASNYKSKPSKTISSTPKRTPRNNHFAKAKKDVNLGDVIGVPIKIVGGLVHGIQKANLKLPRLPNIGGIDLNKAIKTAKDVVVAHVGGLPL